MVSVDLLNNGPGGLVMVIPVTSTADGLRSHIELEPGPSGLEHTSHARCDRLRVVSIARLASRCGVIAFAAQRSIEHALGFVLDL